MILAFFRSAFAHSETEIACRQFYLSTDLRQFRIGVRFWLALYVCLAFIDAEMLGGQPLILHLWLVRGLYILFCAIVLFMVRRYIENPFEFDRLALLWGLCSVLWNVLIHLSHGQNSPVDLMIALLCIFTLYMFLPNNFLSHILPPLTYTVAEMVYLYFTRETFSTGMVSAAALCLVAGNMVGIIFTVGWQAHRRREYIMHHQDAATRIELQRLASTDSLTGAYNRRRILEMAAEELYRYKRYGRPFSILLLDMDHFKRVNDTYGHQRGDMVLAGFVSAMQLEKRDADCIGRVGGDEFCMILPETQPDAAANVAGRILRRCQKILPDQDPSFDEITVSIGISQVHPEDETLDPLFARADQALYQAKDVGRNCWRMA